MAHRAADRSDAAAHAAPSDRLDWLRPLLLALTGLLLVALFTGEIRDTDIWLHLKTGQRSLETRSLTAPDPFSFTSALPPLGHRGEESIRYFNLTHEWLAQIGMYLLYNAAGFPALVLVRAALLICFCALVGWIAQRRSGDFFIGLSAALIAAGVAFQFQQSRPFLVTLVSLSLTIAILESRRWMWLLPAVFLIWANCHAGFFTGFLALGAYCGEALIGRLRGKPDAGERRLWLVTGACLLASALNPNGFGVIRILFLYRGSGIQSDNLEWQRPKFWEPGVHSFVLFSGLAALLLARRRARAADWLLYLGFAAMALMAVRNAIFMGLIGPIVIAAYLPIRRPWPCLAAALSAGLLIIYDAAPAMAEGNLFALRAAEWQLPTGAADFIQQRRLAGRMFNSYESGGYLVWRLWPLQRDFIDPRGLSEEAYADYRRILMNTDDAGARSAEKLLRKYGIEMVVMDGFDYLSGQVYPLAFELARGAQPEWKLVHSDARSVLFLRNPPADVRPLSVEALLDSLERQCGEHLRHEPSRPRCARGMAELSGAIGDVARAGRWIERYLDAAPGPDPEAERIGQSLKVTSLNDRALALESKGDMAGAEALFRAALETAEKSLGPEHSDTAGTLNNLADLLETEGRYDAAEPLSRRALRIAEKSLGPGDPRTAMAMENLAALLASEGSYDEADSLYRRALGMAEKALGPDHQDVKEMREEWKALRDARAK